MRAHGKNWTVPSPRLKTLWLVTIVLHHIITSRISYMGTISIQTYGMPISASYAVTVFPSTLMMAVYMDRPPLLLLACNTICCASLHTLALPGVVRPRLPV